MSAHTQGEWRAKNHRDGATGEIRDERGLWIARVHPRNGVDPTEPECVANTVLMAAAPKLLAALVMVRDADNDCRKDGQKAMPEAARRSIDAAIAKAEGRS